MKKTKQFKPNRCSDVGSFSLGGEKKETGRAKGYDKEWEAYRWRFLHYNNTCYACGRAGEKKRGKGLHIDHVIPHRGNQELFWKVDNLIPLCGSCHSVVTGRFDNGTMPDTKGKLKWLAEKREQCGVKSVVKVVQRESRRKGQGVNHGPSF